MMIAGGVRSDDRIRTRPWTTTRTTDWWERVAMTEFQPSDWLEKFRMSKETFLQLCDRLRPRLARQDTSFRLALPVEKRVAVALWRLASNVEYRTISALFGVGKSTVCRCVRDMCHAIVALLVPVYLRPPGERELEASAQLFLSKWGFPHCVAAVATLHTAIITPSDNASDYANPAGWLSVLTQVWTHTRRRPRYTRIGPPFFLVLRPLWCFLRWWSAAEGSSGTCVPVSQAGRSRRTSSRTRRCGPRLQTAACHLARHPPSWENRSGTRRLRIAVKFFLAFLIHRISR